MTGRSRRGVQFTHKHTGSNGLSAAEGRRASFSDASEDGSVAKVKGDPALDSIAEVGKPSGSETPIEEVFHACELDVEHRGRKH